MVVVTVPVVEAMEAREMVVEVRAREAAAMALERGGGEGGGAGGGSGSERQLTTVSALSAASSLCAPFIAGLGCGLPCPPSASDEREESEGCKGVRHRTFKKKRDSKRFLG